MYPYSPLCIRTCTSVVAINNYPTPSFLLHYSFCRIHVNNNNKTSRDTCCDGIAIPDHILPGPDLSYESAVLNLTWSSYTNDPPRRRRRCERHPWNLERFHKALGVNRFRTKGSWFKSTLWRFHLASFIRQSYVDC